MKQLFNMQKRIAGFTLVEIMIAIAVSMILMLGVMQIFSSNKRSHVINNGLARVQENIRFAVKDIQYAGRMAGYVGCSGNIKNHLDENDPNYSDDLFNFDAATGGWEFTADSTKPGDTIGLPTPLSLEDNQAFWRNNDAGGSPDSDLHTSLDGLVMYGTDVLILKWAGEDAGGVELKNMNANNASINTYSATGIAKETIVIVSDCSGGDAFMNTSNENASSLAKGVASGHTPGNKNPSSSKWSHVYPQSAEFLYFVSRGFYIGEGASGEPALFRITYSLGVEDPTIEEIAEGVENMQVLYGIDVDGDDYADRYVAADDVTAHENVVSLKLGLLARTPDEVKETASSNTFNLAGTTVMPIPDRRLRYAFNTTIKLRNKGKK